MAIVKYHLAELPDMKFLTVVSPNGEPLVATSDTHGNFDELVAAARADDVNVFDLFDTGRAIEKKFVDAAYGRIAVRGGQVYFDDDLLDNAIVDKILDFHEQGEAVGPLAAYVENVMANPQAHSREQFYRWIANHHFPISDDGCIVAYKAVEKTSNGYQSKSAGHAFVNGVEYGKSNERGEVTVRAAIPQNVGDVVTMPRSEVAHDPSVACHTGLHAGTWEYVQWFGGTGTTVMLVKINPRDVVSVPNDENSQKVRVCRYEVIGFADSKSEALRYVDEVVEGDAEAVKTEDETALDTPSAKSAKVDGVFTNGDPVVVHVGTHGDRDLLGDKGSVRRLSGLVGQRGVVREEIPPNRWAAKPEAHFVYVNGFKYGLWDDEISHDPQGNSRGKVDTRNNHLSQKRGPGGRFLPKGS